jgi:hypothetical protein
MPALKISKGESHIKDDSAVLEVNLSDGGAYRISIVCDMIGNVYATTRFRRAGIPRDQWEEVVTCQGDNIHRMVQRGHRVSI